MLMVASEAREFTGLLRHTQNVIRLDWAVDFAREAELNGRRVLLVANGPGPVLAARAVDVGCDRTAEKNENVDLLISTGFCGALDPSLKAHEIIVASRVVNTVSQRTFVAEIPRTNKFFATGTLVSINRVATAVAEKKDLRLQAGAAAVEMEAAGVAERAESRHLPFYCVKVVSDRADEGFALDFNDVRDAEGRFDTKRILKAAMRRPSVFVPELLRLRKRCQVASEALGDFLADCRF